MALSPYPIDPALTAIAIAYKNKNYIADLVLPRKRVGKQAFSFLEYATGDQFRRVDTLVGRRSRPNQVTLSAKEVTDATEDHGLDGGVPNTDISNADDRYDPLGDEVSYIQELVAVGREARAADIVFNPATYDPTLRATLAPGSRFGDAGVDVIALLADALDAPLMRPTQMVFGQTGWTKFRRLPAIVGAVSESGTERGLATRQAVADLFEVEEVIVGSARGNFAKEGQTPQMLRLWGNGLALLHRAPVIEGKGVVTFGATFQWGDREAAQWEDKNMGMRGGIAVRTGESVKERVIAKQAGYYFETPFQA